MDSEEIPSEVLADLYRSAFEISELAPWKWMYSIQIFGVIEPRTGLIGFCSVMGKNKEKKVLCVYPGIRGYHTLKDILAGKQYVDPLEALISQDCIIVSFIDRKKMNRYDRVLLRKSHIKRKLKSNVKKLYPIFRTYTPGYLPDYLNIKDSIFLKTILEQALIIIKKARDSVSVLDVFNPKTFTNIHCRYGKEKNGTIMWEDRSIDIATITDEIQTALMAAKTTNLKKYKINKNDVWDIGLNYLNHPITTDGERHYFPRILTVVDGNSGQILHSELFGPDDQLKKIMMSLEIFFIKTANLPAKIFSENEDILKIMNIILVETKVELFFSNRLPLIDQNLENFPFPFVK